MTVDLKNHNELFQAKFFGLCKTYQQEIQPHQKSEILRDYANSLEL